LEQVRLRASNSGPARNHWNYAFGVDDPLELAGHVAHFIQQVQLTKELVAGLPEDEDPSHLSTYFPQLDQICDALLGVGTYNMGIFAGLVTPELLFSLGSCSRAIRRHGGREPTIDTAGLKNILATIHEVHREIVASGLPHTVSLFIIQRLREVEDAVTAFTIAGYSGVESSLDALIGGASWRTPPIQQPQVGSWVKRAWTAIQSTAIGTASIAGSTQTVIESYKAITGE
jgi:hypothetical protein